MDRTTSNKITNIAIGLIILLVSFLVVSQCNGQDMLVTTGGDTITVIIDHYDETKIWYKYKADDERLFQLDKLLVKEVINYEPKIDTFLINGRTEEYCELIGVQKMLSSKVKVSVDFGQYKSFFNQFDYLKNPDGTTRTFNSMIDALNYMNMYGWQFVNAYLISVGSENVYHYVMKRSLK